MSDGAGTPDAMPGTPDPAPVPFAIVPGDRERHAAACAAILDGWIEETAWMPRLHDRASIGRFVHDVVFAMRHVFVAVPDAPGTVVPSDEPRGFLAVDIEDMVAALYVAAPARGRGIGRALVERAKAETPGGLRLWTFRPNHAARLFYAREGFEEIGRTEGDNEEGLPDVLLEWRPGA